jgi:tRNA pseudouridine55 synthase
LLEFNLPEITIRIKCSKGTYVRSLVRDLGAALNWSMPYFSEKDRNRLFFIK